MGLEVEREPGFGNLDAAELQPSCRMPLARRMPTVATRGGTSTGPGVEHVPDEGLAGTRVLALDGDAEPLTPTGHGPLRTSGCQRLDDCLNNFLTAMAGTKRHRRAFVRPNDCTLLGYHLDWAEGAAILRCVWIN